MVDKFPLMMHSIMIGCVFDAVSLQADHEGNNSCHGSIASPGGLMVSCRIIG